MTVSAEGREMKIKTQANGSSAVVWLGFCFELDLLEKNLITLTGFTFTQNLINPGFRMDIHHSKIKELYKYFVNTCCASLGQGKANSDGE